MRNFFSDMHKSQKFTWEKYWAGIYQFSIMSIPEYWEIPYEKEISKELDKQEQEYKERRHNRKRLLNEHRSV